MRRAPFGVSVDTAELRQALTAVLPHVDKAGTASELSGIRFTLTDCQLILTATNRYTAALAWASVLDTTGLSGSPGEDTFQLAPAGVKEILALFKLSKADTAENVLRIDVEPVTAVAAHSGTDDFADYRVLEAPDPALREPLREAGAVEGEQESPVKVDEPVSPATVRFTDVSGLWPGKTYSVPADPHSKPLATLPRLFSEAIGSRSLMPGRMDMAGRLLGLFATAATAYDGRVTIEPTGRRNVLLVTVGKQFLGLLMPIIVDPDSEQSVEIKQAHADWRDTISGL
ncbi:hypothetical protein ACUXNS_000071 [Brevibacterium pityocampae]